MFVTDWTRLIIVVCLGLPAVLLVALVTAGLTQAAARAERMSRQMHKPDKEQKS